MREYGSADSLIAAPLVREKARRAPTIVLVGVVALICTALIVFACYAWPIPTGDAGTFVPPMLTWARGEGLLNCVWTASQLHDPTGQQRMVSHGFLFPMAIGSLAFRPTYQAVALVIGVIQAMTLSLWAFIFWRIAHKTSSGQVSWLLMIASSLSLAGIATFLVGFEGRPEPFVMLLLGLGVASLLIFPAGQHWLPAGGVVGAVAATSPVVCLLCASCAAAYSAWMYSTKRWIMWLVKAFAVSLAAFGGLFWWYPYSLRDWLAGCLHHSAQVFGRRPSGDAFYYWFTAPYITGLGLVFLLGAGVAIAFLYLYRGNVRCRIGVVVSLIALIALGYCFGHVPARNYNVLVLAPLVFGLILFALGRVPATRLSGRLFVIAAVTVLAVSGLGFYRSLMIFPSFLHRGVTLEEGRHAVNEVRARVKGTIWLDTGLFPLVDDCHTVSFADDDALKAEALVIRQADRSLFEPPVIPGYFVLENKFDSEVPRALGVKLANSVRGYNYAIYFKTPKP